LINGVRTDIGEKVTGHNKGTLDIPTQEMVKKVAEKGGMVPVEVGLLTFPETSFKHKPVTKTVAACMATLPNEWRKEFRQAIEKIVKEMHALGIAFGINEKANAGYRTFQQQYDIDSSKTKAGPGESFHNYGLAADLGVLQWVDKENAGHSDYWLGTMDGMAEYKGFSTKIWQKRNAFGGNSIHSLSWEIIHLQGVDSKASGRSALVKCLNKASDECGDESWEYRKSTNKTYECTLGMVGQWKIIGTSKKMWNDSALNCNAEQQKIVKKHMEKAESIALTIEL
jgi:hypothetical protein